ncbi:hypothetical protein JXO52_14240 [bacterium]|nr:hypothetical protein [bacterium]
MKKRIVLLAAVFVALLVSSCIDTTTVVSVKKDGSGTVTETLFFDSSVKEMMEGMAAQFGEDKEGDEKSDDLIDIDEYKEKVSHYGEGVTFVSAEKVMREDGAEGVKVVYAFSDINKLRVSTEPDNPMDGAMGDTDTEGEENKEPITFAFQKGKNPVLTIYMPHDQDEEKYEEDAEEDDAGEPDMSGMGLAMMRPFLKGLRMKIAVELADGRIAKTTAAHVQNYEGKDTITLLEMDFGKIMEDEKNLEKLGDLEKIKNPSVALEKMKDLPGFKAETSEEISVTIK